MCEDHVENNSKEISGPDIHLQSSGSIPQQGAYVRTGTKTPQNNELNEQIQRLCKPAFGILVHFFAVLDQTT